MTGSVVTPSRIVRGRCALCRCRAKYDVHSFRVCEYHLTHGEDDRPCPYCMTSLMFDPRWTYTTTGNTMSKLVERRQVNLPNTIFLDRSGEVVLSIAQVTEDAPLSWPTIKRQSVVMVGVGLQMGTTFTITQWATDHERQLFDAFIPTVALAHRVYTLGTRDVTTLAGGHRKLRRHMVPWPTINLDEKMFNIEPILNEQNIPPNPRKTDINPKHVHRLWTVRDRMQTARREQVWRHNYLNVLDLAMRVFQVEWPEDIT